MGKAMIYFGGVATGMGIATGFVSYGISQIPELVAEQVAERQVPLTTRQEEAMDQLESLVDGVASDGYRTTVIMVLGGLGMAWGGSGAGTAGRRETDRPGCR